MITVPLLYPRTIVPQKSAIGKVGILATLKGNQHIYTIALQVFSHKAIGAGRLNRLLSISIPSRK